jgi:hypothetical protein
MFRDMAQVRPKRLAADMKWPAVLERCAPSVVQELLQSSSSPETRLANRECAFSG